MMKYYSDKLFEANKSSRNVDYLFDTEEELDAAEKKYDEQMKELEAKRAAAQKEREAFNAQRKNDAENIKLLRKKVEDAQSEYGKAMKDFLKKYGYWHETYTTETPLLPFTFGNALKLCDSLLDEFGFFR